MAVKALMADVDGVLIVHPDPRGWSVDLERDLGTTVAALQDEFFKPHFADVIHGRAGCTRGWARCWPGSRPMSALGRSPTTGSSGTRT